MIKKIKKIIRSIVPMPIYLFFRPYIFLIFGRSFISPKPAETSKAKERRLKEGFFEKYCQGKGLDVGFGGDPVTPDCQGFDYEHGDAQYVKNIEDQSLDFVYSSHTLEHMKDPKIALLNWWRVLKQNGYLILYIPHRDLYEKKKTLPSKWNPDHKNFFLLEKDETPNTIGIVPFIKNNLSDAQIVYAKECNQGHTITDPNIHSDGEYSIEVVIRKQKKLPKPYKPERHQKGWGFEDWINNREYCGKLLFFEKGKKCSFHYHEKKHETFFLFSGKLEIKVGWQDDISHVKSYVFLPGDCLEIPIGLRHQMIALEDSNLFEFSTTHYEDDSMRIIKGD